MNQTSQATENIENMLTLEDIIYHLQEQLPVDTDVLQQQYSAAELADIIKSLMPELRTRFWEQLPKDTQGRVLADLGEDVRQSLMDEMETADVVAATESMPTRDLAEVIDELPDKVSEAILESMDYDRRQRLETRLSYDEGTAGRLMSTMVISVRDDVTLGVVQRYLRRIKPLPAHTDSLMVTDDHGIFKGVLELGDVITEPAETEVTELLKEPATTVKADDDEYDVALLFERRDLLSVPVVDNENKLLGRISVDNIVHVLMDEAERALLSRAGMDEEEDLFAPVLPSAQRRAIWLGINLVTVFIAAWVIGQFEAVLDKVVALAVLMPIVASMGGIAGSQTLTLTIRGLALGQVTKSNLRWLGDKEVRVGLLNGAVWSTVVAIVTYLWFDSLAIAAIIAVAMLFNLIAAAFSGILIPVVLDKVGVDPALSGAVILTTVTDIVGFFSFLGLASLFLL